MVALASVACASSSGGLSFGARHWACDETESCTCQALSSHEDRFSSHAVDECLVGNCCLLTQSGANDTSAQCECVTAVSCSEEQKSRKGSTVVSQCPPPGEGPNANKACAASGENCSRSYIQSKDLTGCCDGTVCKPNDADVLVCQAASAEEQAMARQCALVARSSRQSLTVRTLVLKSSQGDLQVPTAVAHVATLSGTKGCLSSLEITLGKDNCLLELDAEVISGKLRAKSLRGEVKDCVGFTGDRSKVLAGLLANTDTQTNDFSFTGLSCDGGNVVQDLACETGTFDFQIDATINEITFEDQHLILEGTTCASLNADCPSE